MVCIYSMKHCEVMYMQQTEGRAAKYWLEQWGTCRDSTAMGGRERGRGTRRGMKRSEVLRALP